MKRYQGIGILLFLMVLHQACRLGSDRDSGSENGLLLATSSNMQYAMQPLLKAFTEETGIPCRQVVGSSGKLTAQILSGAPYDILLAADMQYPQQVHQRGYSSGVPAVYAYGRLVLWSLQIEDLEFPASLSNTQVRHIALANPENAPYGRAAEEALKEAGLLVSLREKLVFGESISQVNQFILSGGADLGFTSESVVRAPRVRGKGYWVPVPGEAHRPIAQGFVALRQGEAPESRKRAFTQFLRGETAQKILVNYGYIPYEQSQETRAL